jgi:hypothetical protein
MIGRVTGIDQQRDVHDGDCPAFGQNNLEAILQRRVLKLREFHFRLDLGDRELRAIHFGFDRRILRERMDLQNINTVGQPAPGGQVQIARRGLTNPIQHRLVATGISKVHLIHCQDVGLASEPADALDAANETREVLRLDPFQFVGGWPFFQEPRHLLIDCFLDFGERFARARRGHDHELPSDLA